MFKYVVILMSTLVVSSCMSSQKAEDETLTAQIKEQAPADSPQQIAMRAAEAFSNAPGLTAEQKLKLHALYTRVYSESMAIRRDIGQSKSLLFMTVANKDYKSVDVTKLKEKIVKLDQRRLKIMFDALEDVQKIVGKGIEAEKIYKHLHDFEVPSRFDRNQF